MKLKMSLELLKADELLRDQKIILFLFILMIFYSCKNETEVINAGIGGNIAKNFIANLTIDLKFKLL